MLLWQFLKNFASLGLFRYNMIIINSKYQDITMKKLSKKQKHKNYAIMLCVVSMIILIYAVTIIKLSH